MIDFNDFDIIENPKFNLYEYIYDFIMSPHKKRSIIIKTCKSYNIDKLLDTLYKLGITWSSGKKLSERNLSDYTLLTVSKSKKLRFTSAEYVIEEYTGEFYYDMCDNKLKQII